MRWLLVGDAESVHVERIVGALVSYGIDVHVAHFGPKSTTQAETHVLRCSPALGDLRYVLARKQVRDLARRLNPDVLNAHYVTSYGLLASSVTDPCVVQTAWGSDLLHTARRLGYRTLTKRILSRASLITGDSQELLDAATDLAPGVPTHRFVFGPPATAWEGTADRQRTVVSVRNHEPLYQVDKILRAWPIVNERLPEHRLVVLGGGSQTGLLTSMLPPNAEVTGHLPHREVLARLQTADVVVSIPTRDGTSAAVLEGLASGCAVVASDLPANREWVAARHLVPPNAGPQVLADAIVEAAGKPGALDRRWELETQVAQLVERVRILTEGAA